MKKIVFCAPVLFLLVAAQSCNQPEKQPLARLSAGEIFDKFRKNVVLIKNKSYYKVNFGDTSAWFTQVYNDDDEGPYADVTFDEGEAILHADFVYGTGFFIGKNGLIATNMHVVAPSERVIAEVDFKKSIIGSLLDERDRTLRSLSIKVAGLRKYHPEDTAYVNTAVPATLLSTMPPVKDRDLENDEADNALPVDTINRQVDSMVVHDKLLEDLANKDFKVTVETVALTIQLDGSTGNEQEYPCHIYSLSNDKNVDVALIQTDDNALPLGVTTFIDVAGSTNEDYGNAITIDDTLKVTTPLYLIGYNYGPEIAKTSDGIKVQLTKGEVTQESDKYRVLYSIPALPGSSGSPVFNSYGQVVAIHYSGYKGNGNFNYGILGYYIRNMVNASPNLEFPL